jgi:hypothetical protein
MKKTNHDFEALLELIDEQVTPIINNRQKEINAAMDNMDPDASQKILNEYKNDVAFCNSVRLLIEKYKAGESMLPYQEILQDVAKRPVRAKVTQQKKNTKTKASTTRLRVIFHDPYKVIQEKFADDTLIAVIKHIGVEKVLQGSFLIAGNPLISSHSEKYRKPCGRHFVFTHCANEVKKKVLEDIKMELHVNMSIELIPCQDAKIIEFPLFKHGAR